jgi:galactose mutarotase-like enzyme
MPDSVTISSGRLTASVAARGAELTSLRTASGAELMWSADPEIWGWQAPNLFPIVGKLADDTLVHSGRRYPMKQHGFLRRSACEIVSAEAGSCAFRLSDSAETRAHYPFAFALTIAYRLTDGRLDCAFTLANPAETPLYASLGAHPAFRWPLGGGQRAAHRVVFDRPEPAPIRRLSGGLLSPEPRPTPVEGRTLALDDALFADDALIFDRLASRRVVYGAQGGPAVALDFADFPDFGIWSKPGAGFLCLEPWQGTASPIGFTGEFAAKPGVVEIAAGEQRVWRYGIDFIESLAP